MKETDNFERLAERLFDGLVEIDNTGRIKAWNRAAERITGYAAEKLIGKQYQKQPARHVSASGRELPDNLIPLLLTLKDGLPRETLAYIVHSDGYRLPVITRTLALWDRTGNVSGALELFNDNKALIAAFQTIPKSEETVLFDPLTGIGNRPHIEMKIRSAIEDYHPGKTPFGILFIDIDHFKDFNDTYGHLLGDKVLRLIANTLRNNLRASDSCGRWGGEEFIGLVHDLDFGGLEKVSEKLRMTVNETKIRENNVDLAVTVSIGSTLIRPKDTFQTLIERADSLMYKSKRAGRNRVTVAK
jgi:diguanylate cyclase (GGDEF)-like protein/PAS domain S-box-containing protein